jgi:serine/threonine-protein kinase HipA
MAEQATDVFVQIAGEDVHAGRLWSHRRRAAESATFAYAEEYLARDDAYALDPALPLASGQHQTPIGHRLFGAFSDCAPDRWGRRLINRAGRAEGEAVGRRLAEIDYLLGVRDDMRQGALRFRAVGSEVFLADEHSGIPPLIELPRLLNASAKLERDEASDEDLRLLLRGGSSLGGARPKAHVIDSRGRVSIAKFPSVSTDEWDVVAWEAVAHELARRAGLNVPQAELHRIDGKSVFIVERFDRAGTNRIGYVSAMTMLEAGDHEQHSYLEIADAIERSSSGATRDLRELWSRIAFSILVSNTDDHLRNHGFLKTVTAGWELAPAFDINPNPQAGPEQFATAIDAESRRATEPLLAVADYFRIGDKGAREILGRLHAATAQWREVAGSCGLDSDALRAMAPAFEHEQAAVIAALAGGADRAQPSRVSTTTAGRTTKAVAQGSHLGTRCSPKAG